MTSPPLRRADGSWAHSDTEKSIAFADYLNEVFSPHPYMGNTKHESKVEDLVNVHSIAVGIIEGVTKSEVVKAIKKLNIKKAPGYDLITGRILKELPDVGFTYLMQIYNAMLRYNTVPLQWKVAQVKMIFKPDKPPEEVKSYRPISLLPTTAKLFESLLIARLMPVIEDKCLIPNYQFGFRHKHGTIDQVHRYQ